MRSWSLSVRSQQLGAELQDQPALPNYPIRDSEYHLPGPPKEPKIMAQYPKIETIGSIGSIVLAILEVQVIETIRPLIGLHWGV